MTPSIVLDALRIMDKYGYGFFDSQIIAAALASGAWLKRYRAGNRRAAAGS